MEEVFLRVSPTALRSYKNTPLCLIGRVESFSRERVHLDCGEAKVQLLTNNRPPEGLAQGDLIEVRGEQLSDGILILSDWQKLGADFDLGMYCKAVALMLGAADSYIAG